MTLLNASGALRDASTSYHAVLALTCGSTSDQGGLDGGTG